MRDMNIARLTSDDLPLFSGIMSDIFPGVTIPTVDYVDMTNAIVEYMNERGLQVSQTIFITYKKQITFF
jgi:dynein heavy chain